ncbi:aconitate hydratase [Lysinibacillus antri]|uniref:Aconitate hydratase n=1 Tax=Lysinibacillus antri TaxID=2498145 RepID=A0A3S0PMR0_9BACI|nr:aconitate hydratase [Lysinibacillus antri]RUL48805.1 aconitate hydratase [Lysinibacillus antri]
MINLLDRHSLHKLVVLELAVRSLQHDYVQLETLKMQKLYTTWTELLLKHLYPIYTAQKRQLAQKQIRIVRWRKIDMYFSDVLIATSGEDIALRYANQALKTEVEELLIQRFLSSIM